MHFSFIAQRLHRLHPPGPPGRGQRPERRGDDGEHDDLHDIRRLHFVRDFIERIDLAVLDGTYTYHGAGATASAKRTKTDTLLVGRDAIAVEAVGAALVGLDPKKIPVIQEAAKRGLGEGNIRKIEVVGVPFESIKEKIRQLLKASKKKRRHQP